MSLTEQAVELYSLFIGEIGIAPQVFLSMTPYQIELAHKGYLKRQEAQINNMLMALRLSLDNEAEPFNLDDELGFKQSTIEKRLEVLKDLKII